MTVKERILQYIEEHPMCTEQQALNSVNDVPLLLKAAVLGCLIYDGVIGKSKFSGKLFKVEPI